MSRQEQRTEDYSKSVKVLRVLRAPSGQRWFVTRHEGQRLFVVPEYDYQDSGGEYAGMWQKEQHLLQYGWQEVNDQSETVYERRRNML